MPPCHWTLGPIAAAQRVTLRYCLNYRIEQPKMLPYRIIVLDGRMDTKSVLTALAALAQESRLAVFRLLIQAGPAGLAASKIAERLAIAPSSLSFHLKELSHAG